MSRIRRVAVIAGAIAALGLVAAAPAPAAERFASSTGINTGNCSNDVPANAPCNLFRAITMAGAGDVVTVLADGPYAQGVQIDFPADIEVRGAPGQPNPQITFSSAQGLRLGDTGSEVRDLTIVDTNATGTALTAENGSLIERVHVRGFGIGACGISDTATIRDSVCWSTAVGAGSKALTASSPFAPGPASIITVRNVTAIATGPTSIGIDIVSLAGQDVAFDGRNVIAQGTGDDVRALGSAGGGDATGVLGFSNYDDADAQSNGGTASVTQEGAATIQGAAPIFQDAASGDFHQVAGSPTIEAGSAIVGSLGLLDFDREARIQGSEIDIGADEFVPPTVPPPPDPTAGDTRAPITQISEKPKSKTKKKKARLVFSSDEPGSTFQCSLNGAPFTPCSSPLEVKAKKGKNTFAVRATDSAGNTGPAAEASWKLKRKKR